MICCSVNRHNICANILKKWGKTTAPSECEHNVNPKNSRLCKAVANRGFFVFTHENNNALNIRRISMLDLRKIKSSQHKLYGYTTKTIQGFSGDKRLLINIDKPFTVCWARHYNYIHFQIVCAACGFAKKPPHFQLVTFLITSINYLLPK